MNQAGQAFEQLAEERASQSPPHTPSLSLPRPSPDSHISPTKLLLKHLFSPPFFADTLQFSHPPPTIIIPKRGARREHHLQTGAAGLSSLSVPVRLSHSPLRD